MTVRWPVLNKYYKIQMNQNTDESKYRWIKISLLCGYLAKKEMNRLVYLDKFDWLRMKLMVNHDASTHTHTVFDFHILLNGPVYQTGLIHF